MLWLEKYRPQQFSLLRNNLFLNFEKYTLGSLPHLLFSGESGYGKRTFIKTFLNHLYGKEIVLHPRKLQDPDISILECGEVIEITPSDYKSDGFNDKIIIQKVIKNISQTKSILFNKSDERLRIIIINSDDLSKEAQHALRRTVEKYSLNVRIFIVCRDLNMIIEPIQSRFLNIRIPAFTDQEIEENLSEIIKKEDVHINESNLKEIISVSKGNMKKALCLAESVAMFEEKERRTKSLKHDFTAFLEWERIISLIATNIHRNQSTETIISIRKELYTLLCGCIPAQIILKYLMLRLIKVCTTFQKTRDIVKAASMYDERLKLGNKDIIHLEAFVVTSMQILLN